METMSLESQCDKLLFFSLYPSQGCIFDLEVFRAGKKGWGLRTNEEIRKYVFFYYTILYYILE